MKLSQENSQIGDVDSSRQLEHLGWSPFFQRQLSQKRHDTVPARVVGVRKNFFVVNRGKEDFLVTAAGSLQGGQAAVYPAVGDWVLLKGSMIVSLLARRNALSRKVPGGKDRKGGESSLRDQVIAANLDRAFIVCGLDRDFNPRRIERYLTMIYNCAITPEIILTKADLHQDPGHFVDQVESVAFGVVIHLISAGEDEAVRRLGASLAAGETATLIGSSGAGKSTLINRLCGKEVQTTGSVSQRLGKGRHTTTSRDLIVLPSGGMLIDNPGIREVALGEGPADSASAFPEIDEFAQWCKFQDCSHTHEPGCRVLQAVSSGELAVKRLQSFQKIQGELRYVTDREVKSSARVEKERWKSVAKKVKDLKKDWDYND